MLPLDVPLRECQSDWTRLTVGLLAGLMCEPTVSKRRMREWQYWPMAKAELSLQAVRIKHAQLHYLFTLVVLPKFGSVQFFSKICEP